jgi:hypothetical protein
MERIEPAAVADSNLGVRVTDTISIVGTAGRWVSAGSQQGITMITVGFDYRFR